MKGRLHGYKGVWVYLGLGNRVRRLLTGVGWGISATMYITQMAEYTEQSCNARARTKYYSDQSHYTYCARLLQLSP